MVNFALGILFANAYGGAGEDWAIGLTKVADLGYVLSGRTTSFGSGSYDALVIKTDVDGVLQWAKAYGGSGDEYFYTHINTSDGGLLFVGYASSYDSDTNAFIVKTDALGNVQWARTCGGTGRDAATAALQLSDGSFVITGYTDAFGQGGDDVFLMKLASDGTLQWVRVYGDTLDDVPQFISTAYNGFVIGGYTASASGDFDVMLLRVDASGNLIWGKAYGQMSTYPNWDFAFSMENYAITGATDGYGFGSYDLFVLKVDTGGNVQWMKVYGGSGWDDGYFISLAPGGGYVVVGRQGSQTAGNLDFWILRIDDLGNTLWSTSWGGSGYEPAASVWPLLDGYAVAGYTYSYGAGQNDAVLMKVSESGLYPNCAQSWTPSETSVNPDVANLNFTTITPSFSFRSVSPTVSSGSLTTTQLCEPLSVEREGQGEELRVLPVEGGLRLVASAPGELRLYLPDGRLALRCKVGTGETRVKVKPGLYIWSLGAAAGKVVVR